MSKVERRNILVDVLKFEKLGKINEEDIKAVDKKLTLFRKFYDKLPEEYIKRFVNLDNEIVKSKS